MSYSPVAPLQVVRVPATGAPAGLMVVLHGWGSNPQDLAGLVPYLGLPQVEYQLPAGPFRHPHSANGRAWYDLSFGFGSSPQAQNGLLQSRQALLSWLEGLEASTGIPPERTVLAGFSQGGAMTLDVGLRFSKPLAGLICMSGYLVELPPASQVSRSPILVTHGRRDQVVPLQAAQATRDALQKVGLKVQYQEFDMGHEVNPAALAEVGRFLSSQLSLQ
ncbi:alpha/beta hydrolase [Leptolyngbya sp. FACHB-261]|uniref:alpha/beta hydrolase n=1 Tax=Leptolyngbya sp. FACHB-261 TaxID=2692806 RepID=UPI00168230DE|nr:dienelactone hydrolase family protein [Leptolyngbya sp. FACHB-261]MBD2099820.1 dienelactone hydrolase family protein [Leptolyngbya sp. FACHB-261]